MSSKNGLPEVSVVLPAYNAEKYIADAIESIINQTFHDFELIIIDDGSTDNTFEIISSFKDRRIIKLKCKENKGNNLARNWGMNVARGKYICVMDSDDIAFPKRIEKQYMFMETNIEYGICGGYTQVYGSSEVYTPPSNYNEIKVWLLCNIIFKHPTIFLRKSFLDKFGLKYNISFRYASDYELLVESSKLFPITNISEIVLFHRKHSSQISEANSLEQGRMADIIRTNQLIDNFGFKPSDDEIKMHLELVNRAKIENEEQFEKLLKWSNKLIRKNNINLNYDQDVLFEVFKALLKSIFRNYKMSLDNNFC
ncbi:MAG: glycosyltransferase family 2 protein [Bacteroidetes bacterium]|nr:glycosyltransferase family 2 protein [Bacteroidota bacterium]